MKNIFVALVLVTGLPLLADVSAHEFAANRLVNPTAPTATVTVTPRVSANRVPSRFVSSRTMPIQVESFFFR